VGLWTGDGVQVRTRTPSPVEVRVAHQIGSCFFDFRPWQERLELWIAMAEKGDA
jgi:hypothetical protein